MLNLQLAAGQVCDLVRKSVVLASTARIRGKLDAGFCEIKTNLEIKTAPKTEDNKRRIFLTPFEIKFQWGFLYLLLNHKTDYHTLGWNFPLSAKVRSRPPAPLDPLHKFISLLENTTSNTLILASNFSQA